MLPEGSGLQYARLSWNDVKHISPGTTLMQHKWKCASTSSFSALPTQTSS